MEKIKSTCPSCKKKISVPEKYFGREVKCPSCGNPLRISMPASQETFEQSKVTVASSSPQQPHFDQSVQQIPVQVYAPIKSRAVYILLALFTGGIGGHNFYAGYTGKAISQLLLMVFGIWLIIPVLVLAIWVLIEIFTVKQDVNGIPFGISQPDDQVASSAHFGSPQQPTKYHTFPMWIWIPIGAFAVPVGLIIFMGLITAVIEEGSNNTTKNSASAPYEKNKTENLPNVSYKIIKEEKFHDYKRSIDVRLSDRVSKETLRNIAYKLKRQDSKCYERTFIVYYLPGMKVDAGGWATSHFNPNLEIKILGTSLEEENRLKKEADKPVNGKV